MIHEAIILAGGLGTRLRAAVPDLPKCMAPVAGRPFLYYLIKYFEKQGINRFIFSLGYMHEAIQAFLQNEFQDHSGARYVCEIEDEPLGTGGAVRTATYHAVDRDVLVVNGDTFFAVNVADLFSLYKGTNADCVLSLKPIIDSERYGTVSMDQQQRITAFREKNFNSEGLINGGVYALNVPAFLAEALPVKFSFETEYLQALHDKRKFYGSLQDGYFIDIGIPADFNKASIDFTNFSI